MDRDKLDGWLRHIILRLEFFALTNHWLPSRVCGDAIHHASRLISFYFHCETHIKFGPTAFYLICAYFDLPKHFNEPDGRNWIAVLISTPYHNVIKSDRILLIPDINLKNLKLIFNKHFNIFFFNFNRLRYFCLYIFYYVCYFESKSRAVSDPKYVTRLCEHFFLCWFLPVGIIILAPSAVWIIYSASLCLMVTHGLQLTEILVDMTPSNH